MWVELPNDCHVTVKSPIDIYSNIRRITGSYDNHLKRIVKLPFVPPGRRVSREIVFCNV